MTPGFQVVTRRFTGLRATQQPGRRTTGAERCAAPLEIMRAAREHWRGAGAAGERGGGGMRAGPLFWILLIFAFGFARYVYLAQRDGDDTLVLASAVAFLLMCALAAAELFGWLW